MAAEEDKKFEAVLGGFLVNDLRIRAGDLHCPESDTLAAYHERSLLPEEMNSWKEHIVGCGRCQAILAELEATDSIPVQVTEKEEVLAGVAGEPAAAGESIPSQEEAPLTLQEKPRIAPIARRLRWQWLVPAAAVAACLLIWVAWHENRSQLNAPAEIKTAKLEPPTAPPPVTSDSQLAVSADEVAPASKDQGAVGGVVSAKSAPPEGLKQFEKSNSRSKVALAKPTTGENSKSLESSMPPADKEAGARASTALDSLSAANHAQNQPAQDAKAGVAGAAAETVEARTLTADALSQNQQAQQNLQAQQNQLNEQKTSGPNPSRHLEQTKKSKTESSSHSLRAASPQPAAPPPAVPAPATAFNKDGSLRLARAVSSHLISAPGNKILWRVGHAGMIEFSSDGGASWSRQISNVSVDLTAGSAPSEKVCWIVGRAGTILLTTDAGSYWSVVHSPLDQEDLGGVRATDALHATIWNLGNTKILETSDAGVTWKPAQAQ